jgi:transcriptional regulator GlxA family with amidase domain
MSEVEPGMERGPGVSGEEGARPLIGEAVERMRLDRATRLLESSGATIKAVAQRCGFGSEEIMRRAFQRRFGVPPLDYRARFR